MEKIENTFIGCAIILLSSYLLVFIGNHGKGLLCSICGFVGTLLQFPTSKIDLLLMNFKVEPIICVLGVLLFVSKIIRNYKSL